MGYWDQTLSPHYGPTRTWNMPTGHQLNSSLWLEVEVLTSLFLLEAWLLPGEQRGRGTGGGWGSGRSLPAVVRELDLRAHLFLAGPGLPSQQQQGLWL